MKKKLLLSVTALTIPLLYLNPAPSQAAHPDVSLYKWQVVAGCFSGLCTGGSKSGAVCSSDNDCVGYVNGVDIAPVTGNEPYSPRATCARACHISEGDTVDTPGHDYGSGLQLSLHDQGVEESDGSIYWQSYETKSFAHGVSVGRHMNQGRNETYTNSTRATFGDPWFTSTPGMSGKF